MDAGAAGSRGSGGRFGGIDAPSPPTHLCRCVAAITVATKLRGRRPNLCQPWRHGSPRRSQMTTTWMSSRRRRRTRRRCGNHGRRRGGRLSWCPRPVRRPLRGHGRRWGASAPTTSTSPPTSDVGHITEDARENVIGTVTSAQAAPVTQAARLADEGGVRRSLPPAATGVHAGSSAGSTTGACSAAAGG